MFFFNHLNRIKIDIFIAIILKCVEKYIYVWIYHYPLQFN